MQTQSKDFFYKLLGEDDIRQSIREEI